MATTEQLLAIARTMRPPTAAEAPVRFRPHPSVGRPAPARAGALRRNRERQEGVSRRELPRLRVRPQITRAPPPSLPAMPLKGKDPSQVANPVPGLLSDRTLRSGDLAMFPDALRVFTGRPGAAHGLGDFAPLARAGAALPASLRRLAAGLKPGWNRAWSTTGLGTGVGTRTAVAAGPRPEDAPPMSAGALSRPTSAAIVPAAVRAERDIASTGPDGGLPARPDPARAGSMVAAIAPHLPLPEAAPDPGPPPGAPPRLRGCPGGLGAGEAPQVQQAFACRPAPVREEAAGPDRAVPTRFALATEPLAD
jgi:hypothetical protein